MPYFCYIVHNHSDRTYNGYTVDLRRRLRQHNGELVGGARATRGRGPWSFAAVLTSDQWDCVSTAMKHEWSIKYPTRRRPRPSQYNGARGRIESLSKVFEHMHDVGCDAPITMMVAPAFIQDARNVSEGFSFVRVSELTESFIDNNEFSSKDR